MADSFDIICQIWIFEKLSHLSAYHRSKQHTLCQFFGAFVQCLDKKKPWWYQHWTDKPTCEKDGIFKHCDEYVNKYANAHRWWHFPDHVQWFLHRSLDTTFCVEYQCDQCENKFGTMNKLQLSGLLDIFQTKPGGFFTVHLHTPHRFPFNQL